MTVTPTYDPREFKARTFYDAIPHFRAGTDTPRAYLERCLNTIAEREPVVRAFVVRNEAAAKEAADVSTIRWREGRPLGPIDGMPIAIKDLIETKDMPTQMGCEAYRGNFPKRDSAAVWALRQAGAIILGKTVTAELGGAHPGATTNPFDPTRTPGGSSSGSAAAVAARMIPAALGTQVGGSLIRPAGYCGNVALKPTQGAINRGERQATSMGTTGVHAGCIEDMWQVAMEIAGRVGGDPGYPGLLVTTIPSATKPERLIVLDTQGWATLDEQSKSAFEALLENLRRTGIEVIRRHERPEIEALEKCLANAREICNSITSWENRWNYRNLVEQYPDGVSVRFKTALEKAEALSPEDYRRLLQERAAAQQLYAAVAPLADALITLSCSGPAPHWSGDQPGERLLPRPTGDFVFNAASSLLFAPAVSLPLMGVGGMPVGVQIMGQPREDARVTAIARWILGSVAPVVIR